MERKFRQYLKSKNLILLRGTETPDSFMAVVSTKPNIEDFTQVLNKGKEWAVRLSKKDLSNQLITGTFFE